MLHLSISEMFRHFEFDHLTKPGEIGLGFLQIFYTIITVIMRKTQF